MKKNTSYHLRLTHWKDKVTGKEDTDNALLVRLSTTNYFTLRNFVNRFVQHLYQPFQLQVTFTEWPSVFLFEKPKEGGAESIIASVMDAAIPDKFLPKAHRTFKSKGE